MTRRYIRESKHGVKKAKSYLTSLVAFYKGVTLWGDKRRPSDVTYLVNDTVLHNTLVSKLEKYGFDTRIVGWIRFDWTAMPKESVAEN